MLVRLGRVQDAVDYGVQDLATPGEALSLAQSLRERQALPEALRVAERGLTLEGSKVALATWMAELARGMGQTGRALDAAGLAFRAAPEVTAYQRVQELAGARWPDIRTDLLTQLRRNRASVPQGPVGSSCTKG
jgi:uncharacterized Zn finger protein